MSAIQKRIIKELYKGTVLSIKNMYLLRCSNISRELIRKLEKPFDITLNREWIDWSDEFSKGSYLEYSLKKQDYEKIEKLYNKYILGMN